MAKRTNPKRVHVTWEDSARITLGWAPRSDYVKATPTIVRTVGWLLKANRRRVIVALSHDNVGNYCQAIVIPRSAVRSVRR